MSRRSGGVAADGVPRVVATLEDALRVAFGPGGRGVMLKEGSTGMLSVTRSSREIARATFDGDVPPPWLLPVLSAAEALQKRAGDGGKGLMLGALAVARLDLSPRIVREVLGTVDHLATLSSPKGKLPPCRIESIVRTFLATRLTPVVLDTLLPSVCDWLNQDRDFASKHVQSLCRVEETLGPVSGVCGEGVTVQGRTENVPKVPMKMKVAVILEGTVPFTDLVGTLIISKCLEEKPMARLIAGGAALVYGLSPEDERLLSEAEGTEVEVKWVKGGVWMSIPGVRQLVVHAPVASLAREIVRTLRDALALVRYADDRVVRPGALERCLLRRVIQTRRGKPPPLGRELLLTLASNRDEKLADDVAAAILDLAPTSPEMMTVLGVAVSSIIARISNDAEGLEPVTLRLAVLSGALSAGACAMTTSAPLPARRLHS